MPLVQTVMWTAVPNGIDPATGKLKVRCLVSPRLSSSPPANQTLGAYATWPAWTSYVAAPGFTLSLQVGATVHSGLSPDKTGLQPSLWPALFPASMLVRPFKVTDFTARKIRSYPAASIAGAIRDLYGGIANERPVDQSMPGRYWTERDGLIQTIAIPRDRESWKLDMADSGSPSTANDFLKAWRFHWTPAQALPVPPRPFDDDVLDFHQVVSLLMEYPILQRRLGLALDFLVPVGTLTPGDTTIRILPPQTGHLAPVTAATYGSGYFWPKAAGDVANNRVGLSGSAFSVISFDVDGAALKLMQFAGNMLYMQVEDQQFLPALRSAGLSVARAGKAAQLNGKFNQAKQFDTTITGGGTVTLDAASLLHGVRWQVYDLAAQQWFSLCERDVRYHFVGLGDADSAYVPSRTGTLREEGTVTTAVSQRVDDGTDDLYLAEYLARWQGENLAATRPGLSLLEPGQDLGEPEGGPRSATDPQLNVKAWPAPQGLPVLRFGREYRMRALATYVGGGGVAFQRGDTALDFAQASGVALYARSEPVAAPEVVLCAPVTPGETITDLVIRTEYDSVPAPAEMAQRHLLPPKVAQFFAEQLGMCDTPEGFDPGIYPVLVQRANAELAQPHYPAGTPVAVPWLPDVYSRGAALNSAAFNHTIDFGYGDWQDAHGVQIRLIEGTGAPTPLPGAPGSVFKLGKGDVLDVDLSSALSLTHLDFMQIWRWFMEVTAGNPTHKKSPSDPYGFYVEWATKGMVSLLTPARRLRFICAVRQPLVVPAGIGGGGLGHKPGENHVTIGWKVAISRKSTVGVDFTLSWTDKVDVWDGTDWSTRQETHSIVTAEVPVALAGPGAPESELDLSTLPGGGVRADLHDTKAHLVTYRTTAKSRFAEYFPDLSVVQVTLPAVVNARGVAEGSEKVTTINGATTYDRGKDYQIDYLTGTITSITISGPVKVEFRPSMSRTHIFTDWVKARTRPQPPVPVQILPTFGWLTQKPSADPDLPGAVLSKRSGNGLRIYFSPPWHSSGDDERLGVVFSHDPAQIAPHLASYVTAWGHDAAFMDGTLSAAVPQPSHVLGNPLIAGPFNLAEIGGLVRIAALTPQWDPKRQLYFSDIEFGPGSAYFPFIRLALCRYQPHALNGCEISPVRLADFAQLAPDRWVSLAYPTATQVTVTVVGVAYQQTYSSFNRGGHVVVTVERRDPGIEQGELGWTAVGSAQLTPGVQWVKDPVKTMWTGTVNLPTPPSADLRLVVRESERHPGGERLVFTDVIALG